MDIQQWLRQQGLEQYGEAFDANDIDMSVLPDLTDSDLKELGVESLGHRRKLLAAIRAFAAEDVGGERGAEEATPKGTPPLRESGGRWTPSPFDMLAEEIIEESIRANEELNSPVCACQEKGSLIDGPCRRCGRPVWLPNPLDECPLCGSEVTEGLGGLVVLRPWLHFEPLHPSDHDDDYDEGYLVCLDKVVWRLPSTPDSASIRDALNAVYAAYLRKVSWYPDGIDSETLYRILGKYIVIEEARLSFSRTSQNPWYPQDVGLSFSTHDEIDTLEVMEGASDEPPRFRSVAEEGLPDGTKIGDHLMWHAHRAAILEESGSYFSGENPERFHAALRRHFAELVSLERSLW